MHIGFTKIEVMEKEIVEKILATAEIYDVVSKYVDIKRVGNSYKCLCPFHDDHNPSMDIVVKKNFCYCHVCNQGGNPVNFIKRIENTDYLGALNKLAEIYNIDTNAYRKRQELSEEEISEKKRLKRMHYTLDWLTKSFMDVLKDEKMGAKAMAYLKEKRAFTEETIDKFQLGFSSNLNFYHVMTARESSYSAKDLDNIKAIKVGKDGKNFDIFSGRVIFPIHNENGEVVAFAGRTMGDSKPKYLNTADYELYEKKNILFGLYQAKEAIYEEHNVYITEGYCDVISMYQKGIRNVVATAGTAFNEGRYISLLRKYVPVENGLRKVTLMFDADKAGTVANINAGKILMKNGFDVHIVLLPQGEDPDSFARSHSAEDVRQYLKDNSRLFLSFYASFIKQKFYSNPNLTDRDRCDFLDDILLMLEKM